jgi:Fe-S cluster assembly scaffold protein SufB
MLRNIIFSVLLLVSFTAFAQNDSTQMSSKKILLVPYPSMMYFSDADADFARFNKTDEHKVRTQMRVLLEKNVHQQLLARFDAVSLMNANSLNGEEELKRIYAATRFYTSDVIGAKKGVFGSNLFRKKEKKQTFYVSDSSTIVGEMQDQNLYKELHKKFNNDYVLYITQFEVITSNKNTIEWVKQDYTRQYVIHYNLWDNTGKLVLAETLTLQAGGENQLKDISEKYMALIAERLKQILSSSIK